MYRSTNAAEDRDVREPPADPKRRLSFKWWRYSMPTSLYDSTVATNLQILGAVEGFLGRTSEHCRGTGLNPQSIVEARLHVDMLPFSFQIASIVAHSHGAIEAVRKGVFGPPTTPELDFAALQKLVTDAREALKRVSPEEVNAFEGKDVRFEFRDRVIPFTAENFLLTFSIPNFLFHSTIAYGILRAKGVPLGKRDFLGQLRVKR
jgi:uncharacterized protein